MLNLSRSISDRGGLRGGGGLGGWMHFLGFRPPADRFAKFLDIHFLVVTDPKNFLKAPIYTIFFWGGGERFFWLVFSKICSSAENLAQTGSFECFGRGSFDCIYLTNHTLWYLRQPFIFKTVFFLKSSSHFETLSEHQMAIFGKSFAFYAEMLF